MKKKLIALDDGHGVETAGKRTPMIPEIGRIIRENEFNKAVKLLTDAELKRCRFDTIFTAPGDKDAPLSDRAKIANKAKADLFISIHYNAFDGKFGTNKGGIETYHLPGSVKGKKLAECVHKFLIQGTPLIDRGVKSANFHLLRETNMPAILIEAGFMDVKLEAILMQDKTYQLETAKEIAKGVCDYYGVQYISEGAKEAFLEPIKPNRINMYSDLENCTSEALKAIEVVNKSGIMVGYPDGSFKPKQNITREEVAIVISRIWEKL